MAKPRTEFAKHIRDDVNHFTKRLHTLWDGKGVTMSRVVKAAIKWQRERNRAEIQHLSTTISLQAEQLAQRNDNEKLLMAKAFEAGIKTEKQCRVAGTRHKNSVGEI